MTLINNQLKRVAIIILIVFGSVQLKAQLMNHYWSQSYNSMSSLLSGAVVAGDAGSAAIYYNPANITEIEEGGNISLAASFFTLSSYHIRDAMGKDKNLNSTNFYVQPQFFSISVNSPFNNWSFAIATFNRVREQLTLGYSESFKINYDDSGVAKDRLTTQYNYKNYYTDDWISLGGAYTLSDNWHLGISINFSFSTLDYNTLNMAEVHPLTADTIIGDGVTSTLLAENVYSEKIKFTNSRMIIKLGTVYERGPWRLGLNVSLPAINILTSGKRALRTYKEVYAIETPEGIVLSDYFISDAQKAESIQATYKLPFSIAIGAFYNLGNNKRIYSTIEYFAGLQPYKMIDAPINSDITTDVIYDQLENKEWLSYAYGAVPVVNIAIGYRWQIKPRILFLMGLRTDFNNIKDYDYGDMEKYATLTSSSMNIYHATGGVQFHYKKHQLIAGTQMSFGRQTNIEQMANFGDDYQPDFNNDMPLLGVRENVADIYYFSLSIFLGATLNFESKKQLPKE